jgi:hypothetical protein
MKTITLNIPDNEFDFFIKLIEKFNYEKISDEIIITSEIKNILDERRVTTPNENYLVWNEAKKGLHFKS